MGDVSFDGKVAFITGGAQGIGAGLAHKLASLGAQIAIADIDPAGAETAQAVNGIYVPLDVTDYDANKHAIETTVAKFGGLDIAVLNAGVVSGVEMGENFDPQRYRRVMDINLDGVVYGINAALPALKARSGGDIVVTASMAGIAPTPFDPIYATNKTALVGLVRSFGLASIADGIRTNAVCPAFAKTALLGDVADKLADAGVPLLTVDDVVNAFMLALTSDQTGECWWVQPGRPSETFGFRRAPGPRHADGASAAAADPETQMRIERERAAN